MVRAQRALLHRVVGFLVRNAGLRQLLDIGTGIPAAPNVHETAQAIAAETRVVYLDNDPFALAHARALLRSRRGGRIRVVEADLLDTESVIDPRTVGRVLDLGRPVGVLLVGVLHQLRDSEDPADDAHAAVRRLVDVIPPGSWIAIATLAGDLEADLVDGLVDVAGRHGLLVTPRTRGDVTSLVEGLEVTPPGVVPLLDWRPDPETVEQADFDEVEVPVWVAVARKP
jgi:hypothetical protein